MIRYRFRAAAPMRLQVLSLHIAPTPVTLARTIIMLAITSASPPAHYAAQACNALGRARGQLCALRAAVALSASITGMAVTQCTVGCVDVRVDGAPAELGMRGKFRYIFTAKFTAYPDTVGQSNIVSSIGF
jgi:hypothetical protein